MDSFFFFHFFFPFTFGRLADWERERFLDAVYVETFFFVLFFLSYDSFSGSKGKLSSIERSTPDGYIKPYFKGKGLSNFLLH